MESFDAGYTRRFRRGSIAIKYDLSLFDFDHIAGSITRHTGRIAFERHLFRRYSIQADAGPQYVDTKGLLTTGARFYTGARSAMFQFDGRKAHWDVAYRHDFNGGGVTLASYNDTVVGSFGYKLFRNWGTSVNLGWARNNPLSGVLATNSTFDSIAGGFEVHRNMGPTTSMFFRYTANKQIAGAPICTAGVCAGEFVRHSFGAGFNWSARPIRLE